MSWTTLSHTSCHGFYDGIGGKFPPSRADLDESGERAIHPRWTTPARSDRSYLRNVKKAAPTKQSAASKWL